MVMFYKELHGVCTLSPNLLIVEVCTSGVVVAIEVEAQGIIRVGRD